MYRNRLAYLREEVSDKTKELFIIQNDEDANQLKSQKTHLSNALKLISKIKSH